jgi:hypothetical protein
MEDSNRLPDRASLAREIIKSQEKTLKQFLGIQDELKEGK